MINHRLTIVTRPLLDFRQAPWNANSGDVEAIARSIARNGVYAPMVVQESTGYIIKGNHTWEAMLSLELSEGPFVILDVDDERAKRIAIADNRTSRLGRDDEALLYEILADLRASDEGFEGTGYDIDDFTGLAELIDTPLEYPEDELDAELRTPDRLRGEGLYLITPEVDDESGQSYEFIVAKRGEKPLTPADLNRIRKALGDPPLSRAELAQQGVPAWQKGR